MSKDRAYYSLTKEQRLLSLCGVPINYLKNPIQIHQLNFAPTGIQNPEKGQDILIPPNYQYTFLLDFFKNMEFIGESTLYAVGTYPTNQAGYQLASLITSTYFEYTQKENRAYPDCKWIDLGVHPDYSYLKTSSSTSLLIIHGISEMSDTRRLELTKDFIRKGSGTTTILIANTSNILQYAINKLEVQPDAVFQLLQTTNVLV